MSTPNLDDQTSNEETEAEYGSLTVEDDPDGTVDPADLAGTADQDDEDVS